MFKISDKVVCVGFWPDERNGAPVPFQRDTVYVIEGVAHWLVNPLYWGVHIVGLPDKPHSYSSTGLEFWGAARFRLLSEVQQENRLKATAEATT